MIKQHHTGGRMQNYHVRPVRYTVSAGDPKGDGWGARMVGWVVAGFGILLLLGPLEQMLDPRRTLATGDLIAALIAIAVGVGLANDKVWGYLGAAGVGLWFGWASYPGYPVGMIVGFGLAVGLGAAVAMKLRRRGARAEKEAEAGGGESV